MIGIHIALYPKAQMIGIDRDLYSASSQGSKRFTTFCGGLCQTAFTGGNCSHAVYNLMITVGFTGAPRTEQSDRPSRRGLRPLLFFEQCVGSLTSHTSTVRRDLYRPYLRRLESLTICRCHCKGSTFSSVI